jgi:hypothetical protein
LLVGLSRDLDPGGTQLGRVQSWTMTADGDVEQIMVSWEDGEESCHFPLECELRRVGSP